MLMLMRIDGPSGDDASVSDTGNDDDDDAGSVRAA